MYSLRLYHDHFNANAQTETDLHAQNSISFVRKGSAAINGQNTNEDNAAFSREPTLVAAGSDGATIWRWEIDRVESKLNLAKGEGITSRLKMERQIKMFELYPKSKWLFKLDCIIEFSESTGLHSHPGSGIRCMLNGEMMAESTYGETYYGLKNDSVWYEEGAYPLVSSVPEGKTATFLRGMILPQEYENWGDTAMFIEGTTPNVKDYKLYMQRLITLL